MPSRRFYVAKIDDFEEIQKNVKRRKLSLKRKGVVGRYVDLTDDSDNTYQLGRIEEMIKKVSTCVTIHALLLNAHLVSGCQ